MKGLPPAFIHAAEADILRDEGEAYGRLLDAGSVPVTTMLYSGTIHDLELLNPIADIPQPRPYFYMLLS